MKGAAPGARPAPRDACARRSCLDAERRQLVDEAACAPAPRRVPPSASNARASSARLARARASRAASGWRRGSRCAPPRTRSVSMRTVGGGAPSAGAGAAGAGARREDTSRRAVDETRASRSRPLEGGGRGALRACRRARRASSQASTSSGRGGVGGDGLHVGHTTLPEASAPPAPKAMSRLPTRCPTRGGGRSHELGERRQRPRRSARRAASSRGRTDELSRRRHAPRPDTAGERERTAASGAARGPACTRSSVTSNDGSPLSRWWTVPSAMSALARVTVQAGPSRKTPPGGEAGMVSAEPIPRTHTSGPRRRSAPSATRPRPRSEVKRDSWTPRSQRPGRPGHGGPRPAHWRCR